jgi:hypothetical protein
MQLPQEIAPISLFAAPHDTDPGIHVFTELVITEHAGIQSRSIGIFPSGTTGAVSLG